MHIAEFESLICMQRSESASVPANPLALVK